MKKSNRITVLLVEEDVCWQEKLSKELSQETDIEVIAIVNSKEKAVSTALAMQPDVILMDINLSYDQDGLEATGEILRTTDGKGKVIMLASCAEKEIIMRSFQHGAVNYVTKTRGTDIVRAIREAHQDKASIHADAATVIINEIRLMVLTPIEREVYELRESGLSKTQIAEKLHKSINTIKSQIKSIRSKLTYW